MLTRRIVPSLLLNNGRLVKGSRFSQHRDAGRPDTTARTLNAQKADELILLDIGAAKDGRGPDLDAVRAVALECRMPLCVGGGIRSLDMAHAVMALGADKLCLGTSALDDPGLIDRLSGLYGAQAIVIAVDAVRLDDGALRLYDHRTGASLPGSDPLVWARECVERGAGEIRLCAVHREGTRQGMDIDLLCAMQERVNVPIIFEAGAGTLDDLHRALAAGAPALGIGSLIVFADNNIVKIKSFLSGRGHPIRL